MPDTFHLRDMGTGSALFGPSHQRAAALNGRTCAPDLCHDEVSATGGLDRHDLTRFVSQH